MFRPFERSSSGLLTDCLLTQSVRISQYEATCFDLLKVIFRPSNRLSQLTRSVRIGQYEATCFDLLN